MEDRNPPVKPELRVVALCPGVSDWRSQAPDLQWIPVSSSYEAAAEILSAPTEAIVVDLTILSKGHMKLLDVARQMGTEVLAVGAIPTGLTSEDLSGVRMISKAGLTDMLRRLRETEAPEGPIGQGAAVPGAIEPERAAELSSPARCGAGESVNVPSPGEPGPNALQELLKESAIPALDMDNEDTPISRSAPEAGEGKKVERIPSSPSELLSDAELAALLEDEP